VLNYNKFRPGRKKLFIKDTSTIMFQEVEPHSV